MLLDRALEGKLRTCVVVDRPGAQAEAFWWAINLSKSNFYILTTFYQTLRTDNKAVFISGALVPLTRLSPD
jgi:hypothetical protein